MTDDVSRLRPRMVSFAYRMLGSLATGGAVVQVGALRIEGGVRAVYITNNPDKLSRWSVAKVE